MKKVAIVLTIILMTASLCSCVNQFHFDYDDLKTKVKMVEIVEYNPDTQTERMMATLIDLDREQFLLDLSKLEYHYMYGTPIDPEGLCVKLTYTSEEYEIIGWCGTTKHKQITCNQKEFDELIKNYLDKNGV